MFGGCEARHRWSLTAKLLPHLKRVGGARWPGGYDCNLSARLIGSAIHNQAQANNKHHGLLLMTYRSIPATLNRPSEHKQRRLGGRSERSNLSLRIRQNHFHRVNQQDVKLRDSTGVQIVVDGSFSRGGLREVKTTFAAVHMPNSSVNVND